MKNRFLISLSALLCMLAFCSCSDDEDTVLSKIPAEAKGQWTDPRDGNVYEWVRYGDTEWMAENFKYNLEGSLIYQNYHDDGMEQNLAKYGRLYDYRGAVAACPEGWRLPTDEDWQKLEQYMGMSKSDAAKFDWRGDIATRLFSLYGHPCDLNLLLAGYYTNYTIMGTSGYRFMGIFGFYWTATRDESKDGEYYFYRKFTYAKDAVYRQSMEPGNQYLSVRYVRDAQ